MARSSNLEDAVRIPNRFIRRVLHRNKARILGCNFSVERRLLEEINGFDEEYTAPGVGEDTDIAFRLGLVGATFVTLTSSELASNVPSFRLIAEAGFSQQSNLPFTRSAFSWQPRPLPSRLRRPRPNSPN